MSNINFSVIVESLLCESLYTELTPQVGDSALTITTALGIAASLETAAGGSKHQSKDKLLSSKPIWPHIDTLVFIFDQLVSAQLIANKYENMENIIKPSLEQANNFTEFITKIQSLPNAKPNDQKQISDLIMVLDDRFKYFKNNFRDINNFQYNNQILKQLANQTSTIAAESYLNLTPQKSIVKVLQDFGGYDIKIAEKIVMYPGENKYTQMGPHIEGVVMGSIIETSKLLLTFYREHIQKHSAEILDHIKYFLESTDRWYVFRGIDQNSLVQLVKQIAGKRPDDIFQATASAGREINPTDPVVKYIHDDYIAFLNGTSGLVLENYDFASKEEPELFDRAENEGEATAQNTAGVYAGESRFNKFYKQIFINEQNQPQPIPLIKTINDFSTLSGTGQKVYQSYLHLFNNMKKGEVPSKWQKLGQFTSGILKGIDDIGDVLGSM
jgi:hypothetical protein